MKWFSHNKTMFHTHEMHQLSDYDPIVFMVELALLKLRESEYSDLSYNEDLQVIWLITLAKQPTFPRFMGKN